MSGTAPYEVNITGSDDETFQFAIPFETDDGAAFPFSIYAIEYSVMQGGSSVLTLKQGDGITINAPDVVFRAARGRLRKGEYRHGCRIRSLVNGDEFQVFDGSVVIGGGGFR